MMSITQKCVNEVFKVAGDVAIAKDAEIPPLLLRLGDVAHSPALDSMGLREVKRRVWECDLIHVVVEVLRHDFSLVRGQWNTAARLASILSTLCVGLNPTDGAVKSASLQDVPSQGQKGRESKPGVSDPERVKEYYEILLPTAVDSLLILANNLLELESLTQQGEHSHEQAAPGTPKHLDNFKTTINSLLSLCTSHKLCISRAIQSPYLLHMLITDIAGYCQAIIPAIRKLVRADKSVLASLPEEAIHGILDEIVYKVSGSGEKVAVLALKLLASLINYSPSLVDVISSRYKGLLGIVLQWKGRDLDSDVEHLVSQIEKISAAEQEFDALDRAAVTIQAAWRGYASRKKIKRMHRGMQKFQKLYRGRKAEQQRAKQEELVRVSSHSLDREATRSSLRAFHEKQMATVEQLPSSEVQGFVKEQQDQAATRVQSWWRSKLARDQYKKKQEEAELTATVVTLQRAVRRFLQQKKRKEKIEKESKARLLCPEITGAERDLLQKEITQYRELCSSSHRSDTEYRELHGEAQTLLEDYYARREPENRKEAQRALLLSKLNRDCELLLSAPPLSEVTPDVIKAYSSGSTHTARTAQLAHREELRAMELPWWKRPVLDNEDVDL